MEWEAEGKGCLPFHRLLLLERAGESQEKMASAILGMGKMIQHRDPGSYSPTCDSPQLLPPLSFLR